MNRPIAATMLALLLAFPADASGDRLNNLSRTLSSSSQDKARIAAAVSLGRMKDHRAIRPLVRALRDENRVVRAIAAASLGYLGDPQALPSLERAMRDSDPTVRRRATQAIVAIRAGSPEEKVAALDAGARERVRSRPGFGNRPRALAPRPTLYLVLASVTDESRGRADERLRARRTARLRSFMESAIASAPDVTTSEQEASAYGIARNTIDAAITKLTLREAGPQVEVECEIRITISDQRGRMLSFLTGGAKVEIPRALFRDRLLPSLRLEVLEHAVKSVHRDLLAHLRPRKRG